MIIKLIEYQNYKNDYRLYSFEDLLAESEILLETREICQIRRIEHWIKYHPDGKQGWIIDEKQLIAKIITKFSDEILYIKIENNNWDGFIKKLGIEL